MPTLEVTRWRRERLAFGRIRCTPPEGEDLAEIVIHERVRPLASLHTLAVARGAAAADVRPATVVTVEGELGAIASFAVAGRHHTLGVIYGDDFQAIVDARTEHPDQRERVREVAHALVLHFPLGLGRMRHRRFWYRPPPGWQGLARNLVTDWFALDHPRDPATIKVMPARPPNAVFHLDTLLRDDVFAGVAIDDLRHEPLAHAALRGTLTSAVAGARAFQTAVLEDREYLYVLRLATTIERLAEHQAIFHAVVRSCIPLPLPTSTTVEAARVLDYLV